MEYTRRGAAFSSCGKYRYLLWREWAGTRTSKNWQTFAEDPTYYGEAKSLVFAMLNPSTADGNDDDPTIRPCVRLASYHGYLRIEVVNLFAYRATDPRALLALTHNDDPVGVDNQRYWQERNDDFVVCAWGNHGTYLDQDQTALGWVYTTSKLRCLGLNKSRAPKHPLFVRKDTPLLPYTGRR